MPMRYIYLIYNFLMPLVYIGSGIYLILVTDQYLFFGQFGIGIVILTYGLYRLVRHIFRKPIAEINSK